MWEVWYLFSVTKEIFESEHLVVFWTVTPCNTSVLEEHATSVYRIEEKHATSVYRVEEKHATSVYRVEEKHAISVYRVEEKHAICLQV